MNESNYYKWENPEDKSFFAVYCNTAQHNARTILNTIVDKISLVKKDTNDTTSEGNLHKSKVISELNDENKTIQHSSIIDLLERNLPFAIIQIKEPKKISERLTVYLKALNALRNFYSHYSPEKSFTETLEKVSALKEGKTFLNQDLSVIKKNALTVVEKRFPLEKEAGIYIKESAQDFIPSNKSSQYDDFKYSFKKTNKKLNEDDFLFFLSLFLTRKETEELLNHIRGKKSTLELYHKQIRHFFTALNAKKFQSKLVSTNPRQALILNLINQLGRLPRHLEPYLNKKAQESLLIKEKLIENIKENLPRIIKKLRYKDIFAYHALQLLEYTELISNIQFQINLGKVYLRAPYDKIINGREVKREIDKNLLAMGYLKDFDDSFYKGYIKREENKDPEFRKPLKYYRPKYHFAQNRIGISFLKKEKENSEKEKLSLKEFEETEHWQFNHHNTLPQFILSHKVMPFMIYLELKSKQKGKISFVEIILNKYKSNFI